MLRPTQDYIVVKPLTRIASEIIQVVMSEKPNTGVVMAVGPGKDNKHGKPMPLDIKRGEVVRFGTSAEYLSFPEHWENGEKYLILQEADICFVQED